MSIPSFNLSNYDEVAKDKLTYADTRFAQELGA